MDLYLAPVTVRSTKNVKRIMEQVWDQNQKLDAGL